MSDINLLPEDLRHEEEKELRQKDNRLERIEMSTPVVENEAEKRRLTVSQSVGQTTSPDPKLPFVRDASYIGVDPQGKIVHESVAPVTITTRPVPWWRRLFLPRLRVERVRAPHERDPSSVVPGRSHRRP